MRNPVKNNPQYNPDVIRLLLQTINSLATEVFLQPPKPNLIPRSRLQTMIPEQLDKFPLETILWNLRTLSNSDLIHPSFTTTDIQEFAKAYKTSDDFLFGALPQIATKYALTVQGQQRSTHSIISTIAVMGLTQLQ